MTQKLYFDILDENRKEILPILEKFKSDFYLAGGTALALQLGHRDSIDFDFFTSKSFSTIQLFELIKQYFTKHRIKKTQEEKDTLSVIINDRIKMSFMFYPYKLINEPVSTKYFNLASITDIGCMKLSAITSRSATKDYVDIYFILKQIHLNKLLISANKKLPDLDQNLILKSLIYFNDLESEEILYKHQHKTNFDVIKKDLITKVKNL